MHTCFICACKSISNLDYRERFSKHRERERESVDGLGEINKKTAVF